MTAIKVINSCRRTERVVWRIQYECLSQGIQIRQRQQIKKLIFICVGKYGEKIAKKFDLNESNVLCL